MRHISDDLPRLLTGDATRDVVLEAATHLRVCVDCQQELVSAVIAHASLTAALRFAPEIVAPGSSADESDDATDRAFDSARADDGPDIAPVVPLPDLSGVFAEARADAAPAATPEIADHDTDHGTEPVMSHGTDELDVRRRGRVRRGLVAAVAAAAVVVGGGVTYAAIGGDDSPASRTVALEGSSDGLDGSVVLVGSNRMRIDASALPELDGGRQYEVWLTDDDGVDKQPVGYIDTADRKKDISVPSKIMSQYNNIAISVQKLKQTEYSGITVLSGTYG